MKIKSNFLFLGMWVVHIIVYYYSWALLRFLNEASFPLSVSLSRFLIEFIKHFPVIILGGIFGLMDGGMLYSFVALMAIFYYGFRLEIFSSYYLSLLIAIVLWPNGMIQLDFMEWSGLFYVVLLWWMPCAVISIIANWLIFRNTFRRLRTEE